MEVWDSEFVDLEGPGYISFSRDGMGEFHFGAVHGWIDCRYVKRYGRDAVEFSWEGNDESDSVCGRGWAVREGDRLNGHLFIHHGDDSGFVAERQRSS